MRNLMSGCIVYENGDMIFIRKDFVVTIIYRNRLYANIFYKHLLQASSWRVMMAEARNIHWFMGSASIANDSRKARSASVGESCMVYGWMKE